MHASSLRNDFWAWRHFALLSKRRHRRLAFRHKNSLPAIARTWWLLSSPLGMGHLRSPTCRKPALKETFRRTTVRAVYEDVNEFWVVTQFQFYQFMREDIPLLAEEGWTRHQ